jgi:hypothetical protein
MSSKTISVTLPDSKRKVSVEIFGPTVAFGERQPATVNWSAIGSVSPIDARIYASALADAAIAAERWDEDRERWMEEAGEYLASYGVDVGYFADETWEHCRTVERWPADFAAEFLWNHDAESRDQ